MTEQLTVTIEPVDDIPVLLASMERMGLAALIDAHFVPHGNWHGLRPGQMLTCWLAYILSEADHRLNQVQDWVTQRLATLRGYLGADLHEGQADACERACYECLCNFYNQLDHERRERRLVMPLLRRLAEVVVEPLVADQEAHFAALLARCESGLERRVLHAICQAGLPLPAEAQKLIEADGAPIAIADFYYPRTVIFVDGSPHHLDWVARDDAEKRARLRRMGLRVIVMRGESLDADLAELRARIVT